MIIDFKRYFYAAIIVLLWWLFAPPEWLDWVRETATVRIWY